MPWYDTVMDVSVKHFSLSHLTENNCVAMTPRNQQICYFHRRNIIILIKHHESLVYVIDTMASRCFCEHHHDRQVKFY